MSTSDKPAPLEKLRSREFKQLAQAVRSGTLEGDVVRTVEKITENWKIDLQAYTIGLARMKAVSVTKILEVILKVQDEVARRIDLKQASLPELTSLLRVLRDFNNEDANFIHDLAFGDGEKFKVLVQDNRTVNVDNRSVTVFGGEVSQEGRERIRKLVDGVLQRVEGGKKAVGSGPESTAN